MHGHRWRDTGGAPTDTTTVGPSETITARFTEDNPGRWLYHCHVFSHQDEGMAGWYDVTRLTRRRGDHMRMTLAAAAAAAARCSPPRRARRPTRSPRSPGKVAPKPKGPFKTHTVCKKRQLRLPHDPGRGQQGQGRRQDPRAQGRLQGGGDDQRAQASATCGSSATRKKPGQASCSRARARSQNGFFVNGADQVTIDGFTARNYKANGFFVTNAVGYKLTHLVAAQVRRLRRLRLQLQGRRDVALGGLLPLRRGLLHRADAAADQADPLDRARRRRAGATRSASRPRTCAT